MIKLIYHDMRYHDNYRLTLIVEKAKDSLTSVVSSFIVHVTGSAGNIELCEN